MFVTVAIFLDEAAVVAIVKALEDYLPVVLEKQVDRFVIRVDVPNTRAAQDVACVVLTLVRVFHAGYVSGGGKSVLEVDVVPEPSPLPKSKCASAVKWPPKLGRK